MRAQCAFGSVYGAEVHVPKLRHQWAGCCFDPQTDCTAAWMAPTGIGVYWGKAPYLGGGGLQYTTTGSSGCEDACMKQPLCVASTFVPPPASTTALGQGQVQVQGQGQCWLAQNLHSSEHSCGGTPQGDKSATTVTARCISAIKVPSDQKHDWNSSPIHPGGSRHSHGYLMAMAMAPVGLHAPRGSADDTMGTDGPDPPVHATDTLAAPESRSGFGLRGGRASLVPLQAQGRSPPPSLSSLADGGLLSLRRPNPNQLPLPLPSPRPTKQPTGVPSPEPTGQPSPSPTPMEASVVLGPRWHTQVHASSRGVYRGQAPYLVGGGRANLQPDQRACERQCASLVACHLGTFLPPGNQATSGQWGECWLSTSALSKELPCAQPHDASAPDGMVCHSFYVAKTADLDNKN